MAWLEDHSSLRRGSLWKSSAATWVLLLLVLPFLEGQGLALEAAFGAGLIALPFVILAHLAALAMLAGIRVGALNLTANVGLAAADSCIRELIQEHFAEPIPPAPVAAVAVVEEVLARLFPMSSIAWIRACFSSRPRSIFAVAVAVAVAVSSLVFGAPHLRGRPMPER